MKIFTGDRACERNISGLKVSRGGKGAVRVQIDTCISGNLRSKT